jgi:hypothetical protein
LRQQNFYRYLQYDIRMVAQNFGASSKR